MQVRIFLLSICLSFALGFSPATGWALDPYEAIESLLSSEGQPRILNTEDLDALKLQTPFPLISPTGDFNKDGFEDIALSGIFDLPPSPHLKYFLLVASFNTETKTYRKLLLEQYPQPIFIHLPGTTGPEDPKDQIFSTSFCINCQTGTDYYWNHKTGTFLKKSWHQRPHIVTQQVQEEAVPQDKAERLLKIASQDKEVTQFIQEMSKAKMSLNVKIHPDQSRKKPGFYWIEIGRVNEGTPQIQWRLLVDGNKEKILKRIKVGGKKSPD